MVDHVTPLSKVRAKYILGGAEGRPDGTNTAQPCCWLRKKTSAIEYVPCLSGVMSLQEFPADDVQSKRSPTRTHPVAGSSKCMARIVPIGPSELVVAVWAWLEADNKNTARPVTRQKKARTIS